MRGRTLLLTSLSLALAAACTNHEQHFVGGPPEIIDSVQELEEIKVELPQAGNVALVEQYCVPCHSLRYIEMQPELTHKAWEKIVDKMIKAYGAPIPDSQTAAAIVDYLWAVRGKEG
jgi:hypothetical protein